MRRPTTAKLESHCLSDDGTIFLVGDTLTPDEWHVIDSEPSSMPISFGAVMVILVWVFMGLWLALVVPLLGLCFLLAIVVGVFQGRQIKPAWRVLLGNGTGRHVWLLVSPDEWPEFSNWY